MNLYRNCDREKVQFDFVCHDFRKNDFEDEINKLGGRIFKINSLGSSGPIKYIKDLKKIIQEQGPYIAIHAHTDIQIGIVNLAGLLSRVKMRICHAHTTKWRTNPTIKDNIESYILRVICRLTSTKFFACGKEAGIFFYGKRNFKKGKVSIINNGINLSDFIDNDNKVELSFKERNEIIIGHVGRFSLEKNHDFLINLAKKLLEKNLDFKMIFVGDGPERFNIEKRINNENLDKNIIMLGVRSDVNELMKQFDCLLLPSFYEGLPVTLIEAQAASLKCIISDVVSKEVDMGLNLIQYLDIEDIDVWANAIINLESNKLNPKEVEKKIIENGYSAKHNIKKLIKLYGVN